MLKVNVVNGYNAVKDSKQIFNDIKVGQYITIEIRENCILKNGYIMNKYDNAHVVFKNNFFFQVEIPKKCSRISITFNDIITRKCKLISNEVLV